MSEYPDIYYKTWMGVLVDINGNIKPECVLQDSKGNCLKHCNECVDEKGAVV